jgi:hypothetical protein
MLGGKCRAFSFEIALSSTTAVGTPRNDGFLDSRFRGNDEKELGNDTV